MLQKGLQSDLRALIVGSVETKQGKTAMFSIQQTANEAMVWAKTHDGRKICVFVGKDRLEASLWIETANRKLKGEW